MSIHPGNRVVHAALETVAHMPGNAYNPLWLFGPSGTGKTAMIRELCSTIREKSPHLRVRCIQTDELLEMLNQSGRNMRTAFQETFSGLDVLAVEDLHTLADNPITQSLFGYLLSGLVSKGGQVVLTSTGDIGALQELQDTLSFRCDYLLVLKTYFEKESET